MYPCSREACMIYSSKNGCLFYYDRVLYTWQVAEPTMLFLLGLESITSYTNALSDSLVISNSVYIKSLNDIVPFEHFNIYDKIHSYLSQLSSIEDLDYYLKFNCNGLKLLLNELTGTGSDRTVPIIFRNDVNNKSIDLNSVMYRLTSSESATLFDRQAQKIIDIFYDAGWSGGDLIDTSGITDSNTLAYLKLHNSTLSEYYSERRNNGQIYKLLDYKSMYSYALGVLYGCRCLGFSPKLIWRIDPKFWYNGEFVNLVSTAWYTFRFHHTHYIPEIDESSDLRLRDKYKGITPNRLWNFGSDKDIDLVDDKLYLRASELNCYALYVNKFISKRPWSDDEVLYDERVIAEPIIYSQFDSKSINIDSVYVSYNDTMFSYNCFILTAFGDSLPANGDYHFIISVTSEPDVDPIIKDSLSKNLFVLSTSDSDNDLFDYLNRFYSGEEIQIEVVVKIGDNYTSDPHALESWLNITPRGEYLSLNDLENLKWEDINTKLSSQLDPSIDSADIGIVYEKDSPIVRYIADDPVVIRKAYRWSDPIYLDYSEKGSGALTHHQVREPKYLSPKDKIYFIVTGSLGWCYFDENHYRDDVSEYQYKLSIIPYSDLESDRSKVLPSQVSVSGGDYIPIRYALYKEDNSIVTYYKCQVSHNDSEDIYMYAIFNGNVQITKDGDYLQYDYSTLTNYSDDEDHKSSPRSAVGFFKSFVSDDLFDSCYSDIALFKGYTISNWYDITKPVSIFVSDEDSTLMFNGDEDNPVPISNYGYTPQKASVVDTFIYDSNYRDEDGRATPKPFNVRLYNGKYWSSEWRSWYDASNMPNSEMIYLPSGDTTPIYRGQNLIERTTDVYINIYKNNRRYIFNNSLAHSVREGFIDIKPDDYNQSYDTLWRYGYTTHVCKFILQDDNGNYLTDDETSSGTPLVWYDSESNMYWNGFIEINRWQATKPALNSQLIYTTTDNQYSHAIDDPVNKIISIDGSEYISYDEFYSDNTRGAVRYKLQVFNDTRPEEGIIDCLVDDKSDKEHPENTIYCIPDIKPPMTEWVSRERLLPEFGYRFVDGMTSLFLGTDKVSVVIDDDFKD